MVWQSRRVAANTAVRLSEIQRVLRRPPASYLHAHVPAKRLGEHEEQAELVAFFASDKCNFINGQTIHSRVHGQACPNGRYSCRRIVWSRTTEYLTA